MTAPSRRAFVLGSLLLAVFAILAWTSSSTESATTDEPMHLMGAYTRTTLSDFRVDRENPPLFGYIAMLPHWRGGLTLDTTSDFWTRMPSQMWLSNPWAVAMLYQVPGNDGDRFIQQSRAMMILLGVLLGATICTFAGSIVGPRAAVCAAMLFALDPNFLAHSPLIKNDVPLALTMACLSFALWRAGRNLTPWNAAAVCFSCAAAAAVKFSGVTFIGFTAIVLAARAISAEPWSVFGRITLTRFGRAGIAGLILLGAMAATITLTWACYGFRFAPTPDPHTRLDLEGPSQLVRRYTAMIHNDGRPPTPAEVDATADPLVVLAVRFMERHHLMPQAWCAGMIYIYATTLARPAYLFGQYSWGGWWYYFPLACLFKTPVAILLAVIMTACYAIRRGTRNSPAARWTMTCLFLPAGAYTLMAMTSHVNAGLRHLLPVYPAAYVAVGAVAAQVWAARRGRVVIVSLVALLFLENFAAYPNYISFFNFPSGGARGGASLLGDSNLDWGQDLKRLVAWQQAHPQVKLYAAYAGSVDPRFYGLSFTPVIGNSNPPGAIAPPASPGVLAISVSLLQGMYAQPERNALYAPLRSREPIEILGGSIYLYRMPMN